MNSQLAHKNRTVSIVGNGTAVIAAAQGTLESIVISKDGGTSNVARAVTVTATLAEGFTQAFGPVTVGNGQVIYHPRQQAIAADLVTAIAGIYDQYYLDGKVSVLVAADDPTGITRVTLILVP